MSQKTTIEISSVSDFREKIGLDTPVSIEWKDGNTLKATQDALDSLKQEIAGKDVAQQQKLANDFVAKNLVAEQSEKKDALNTLKDKIGDRVFSNPKVLAGVVPVAGAVGALANKLDQKSEKAIGESLGFMDSIRDWLKKASEDPNAMFQGLWKFLYQYFSGEKDDSKGTNKTNESGKNSPKESISKEGYRMTAIYLIRGQEPKRYSDFITATLTGVKDELWGKDELQRQETLENTAVNILLLPDIQNQTYSGILAGGESFLQKKANKVNPEIAERSSRLVIQMLKENEGMFQSALSSDPNWKNKPLNTLLEILYHDRGYSSMEKLSSALRNVGSADIKDMKDFPKNFFGSVDMTANPPKFGGILGSKSDALQGQGLTPKLAENLMFQDNIANTLLVNSGIVLDQYSEKEKEFLSKMTNAQNFLNPLKSSIKNTYHFSEELMSVISPDALTLKDMFELYVLTNGQADVSALKEGDRALLVAKLQFLFVKNKPDEYGKFVAEVAKNFEKNKELLMTLRLLSSTTNKAAYIAGLETTKSVKLLLSMFLNAAGIDTTAEKVAAALGVSVVGIGIIWGAFALFPASIAIIVLGGMVTALGYSLVALAQRYVDKKN